MYTNWQSLLKMLKHCVHQVRSNDRFGTLMDVTYCMYPDDGVSPFNCILQKNVLI